MNHVYKLSTNIRVLKKDNENIKALLHNHFKKRRMMEL